MYDRGKIIVGVIVFLVVTTFPFWYNKASGTASTSPPPKEVAEGLHCVENLEFMRSSHMQLLNEWRDTVVRDGRRTYESKDFEGEVYAMSLSNTCLKCHADWTGFPGGEDAMPPDQQPRGCLECHDYAGVEVYCYDCHVHPEEY
jgi:hypothetical protein